MAYLWQISGISLAYFRHISLLSQEYFRYISGLSQPDHGYISGIYFNIRHILEMSQVYLRYDIYQVYIEQLLGIFQACIRYFSNGPDDVGHWQRATFKFLFFFFFFPSYSGDLYWIGSDKSCSTLIGRHKLGVVQMHVYQPLTKLWCVHLLNPAMQCRGLLSEAALRFFSLAEQCNTQKFYLRCFKSDTAYPGH